MQDLFEAPIKETKVRKDVTAFKYPNGAININGVKYLNYSMSEAIKVFRKKFPAKGK